VRITKFDERIAKIERTLDSIRWSMHMRGMTFMIRASMVCKHRVHDNDGRQEINLLVASVLLHSSAIREKEEKFDRCLRGSPPPDRRDEASLQTTVVENVLKCRMQETLDADVHLLQSRSVLRVSNECIEESERHLIERDVDAESLDVRNQRSHVSRDDIKAVD
jgi:hypothetical protein